MVKQIQTYTDELVEVHFQKEIWQDARLRRNNPLLPLQRLRLHLQQRPVHVAHEQRAQHLLQHRLPTRSLQTQLCQPNRLWHREDDHGGDVRGEPEEQRGGVCDERDQLHQLLDGVGQH